MTDILQVITQYCAQYVDDLRLQELATVNPPLYARRMWGYLLPAVSLFTIPAEMIEHLSGRNGENIHEPSFDSAQAVADDEKTADWVILLGDSFKGFELFNARIQVKDKVGNIGYEPGNGISSYDSAAGTVTVSATTEHPIAAGTVFDFDFYTDGFFKNTLSASIMNILGMCFQVIWQERFNTDWLSMVSKVEDKSFYEQNRANKIRADGERLALLREKLAAEMRKYEQNMYYLDTIKAGSRRPLI